MVTSGKLSFLALPLVCLVLVALWFPFWLLAFLVTEWGVYVLFVGTIFFIGRVILRYVLCCVILTCLLTCVW